MAAPIDGLGVRVLDLADVSGLSCARLLVGLGADVIRVEPPGGDPLRTKDPLAFAHWNAGKRSVTLDLETAAGVDGLRRLAARADVLVETFPRATSRHWGSGGTRSERLTLRSSSSRSPRSGGRGRGRRGP